MTQAVLTADGRQVVRLTKAKAQTWKRKQGSCCCSAVCRRSSKMPEALGQSIGQSRDDWQDWKDKTGRTTSRKKHQIQPCAEDHPEPPIAHATSDKELVKTLESSFLKPGNGLHENRRALFRCVSSAATSLWYSSTAAISWQVVATR